MQDEVGQQARTERKSGIGDDELHSFLLAKAGSHYSFASINALPSFAAASAYCCASGGAAVVVAALCVASKARMRRTLGSTVSKRCNHSERD